MAIFPSSVANSATTAWLLLNTTAYTTGGKTLIELIQSASTGHTSVTDTEYSQYIQYTHTLYIYYQMYRDFGT